VTVRRMSQKTLGALVVGACVLIAAAGRPQDTPLQAGSEGVPVPKRTKTVPPEYPLEAQGQGIRGIVILELVVDPQGKVTSVNVIRSVPGLDEAAMEAARQWEYEITRVGGKPVSVRLTVPITFAMRLPEMSREQGIPELRQGVAPPFPAGERNGADVTAEVTVDSEGQITEARVLKGDAPWSDSMIRALRTWRFASPGENVTVSFRVQAEFIPGRGKDAARVTLRLDGLRRTEGMAAAPTPPPTSAAPATASASPTPAPPSPTPATAPPVPPTTVASTPLPTPPAPVPAPAGTTPSPSPAAPAKPSPAPPALAPPVPPPPTVPATTPSPRPPPAVPQPSAPSAAAPQPAPPAGGAPQTAAPGSTPTPPPVEVVSAPLAPEPPETGASAIRDVSLAESGVPDLAKGRRPLVPPLARMSGTKGTVEVVFSVAASGITSVQDVKGPDLLRAAAEQTVTSWVFRRSKVDRLHLVAVFTYDGDKATAAVKPQPSTGTP